MCWLLYTNLQIKRHYRRVAPFTRLQKSQYKYIVSKRLSELGMSWIVKSRKINLGDGAEGRRGWGRLLGTQEHIGFIVNPCVSVKHQKENDFVPNVKNERIFKKNYQKMIKPVVVKKEKNNISNISIVKVTFSITNIHE